MFDVDDHVSKTGKGKDRVVSCKFCYQDLSNNSKQRWETHLKSCEKTPEYVKSSIPKKRKASASVIVLSQSESGQLDNVSVDSASIRSTPQASIRGWVDRTDAVLLEELNDAFATMIYATGVPFVFADHPRVRDFLHKLKPSWKPPSAKVIAGTLHPK
jgi:hypothetical protein